MGETQGFVAIQGESKHVLLNLVCDDVTCNNGIIAKVVAVIEVKDCVAVQSLPGPIA